MGEFADAVAARLRDALAAEVPGRDWHTEFYVRGTPVDVASPGDPVVLVELEWRRADPSDNPVKLARHVADGVPASDASEGSTERRSAGEFDAPVVLVQAFSAYYALDSGAVSSKRENAEFVGDLAASSLDGFAYHAIDLPIDPPKRGGDRPDGWRAAVDDTAACVAAVVESG